MVTAKTKHHASTTTQVQSASSGKQEIAAKTVLALGLTSTFRSLRPT